MTTTVRFTFSDIVHVGGKPARTVWCGNATEEDLATVINATAKGMEDNIIIISVDNVKFAMPGGAAIG